MTKSVFIPNIRSQVSTESLKELNIRSIRALCSVYYICLVETLRTTKRFNATSQRHMIVY